MLKPSSKIGNGCYTVVSALNKAGGMSDSSYLLEMNGNKFFGKLLIEAQCNGENLGFSRLKKHFRSESSVLKDIHHPNIVRVRDYIEETLPGVGNVCMLVYDFIEGDTLEELVEKQGSLDINLVDQLFNPVCHALNYLHGPKESDENRGIVTHLDLKPANIILKSDADGRLIPILVDFGISRQEGDCHTTSFTSAFGSPDYSPPEQADPETEPNALMDVYSLGAVLRRAITGAKPVSFNQRIAYRKEFPGHPKLKEYPGLEKILTKAVSLAPDERYQSIREFQSDFNNWYSSFVQQKTARELSAFKSKIPVSQSSITQSSEITPRDMPWGIIKDGIHIIELHRGGKLDVFGSLYDTLILKTEESISYDETPTVTFLLLDGHDAIIPVDPKHSLIVSLCSEGLLSIKQYNIRSANSGKETGHLFAKLRSFRKFNCGSDPTHTMDVPTIKSYDIANIPWNPAKQVAKPALDGLVIQTKNWWGSEFKLYSPSTKGKGKVILRKRDVTDWIGYGNGLIIEEKLDPKKTDGVNVRLVACALGYEPKLLTPVDMIGVGYLISGWSNFNIKPYGQGVLRQFIAWGVPTESDKEMGRFNSLLAYRDDGSFIELVQNQHILNYWPSDSGAIVETKEYNPNSDREEFVYTLYKDPAVATFAAKKEENGLAAEKADKSRMNYFKEIMQGPQF